MAYHFIDEDNGNDANTGHDTDNAWATYKYANESGALVSEDLVWVRRNVNGLPTADISLGYSGAADNPIQFIGCPRNTFSITSASWTNGSATVDLILPASMGRRKHQSRYITAPDGESYFITRVIDTNTFIIDREYAGATVTLTDGASTIQADEDYALFAAIDDTTWTIKIADWIADADDMPSIDFNDGDFQYNTHYDNYVTIKNMEFKDSTDAAGVVYCYQSKGILFRGCLFKQSAQNDKIIDNRYSDVFIERCTIEGSGAGAAQVGYTQIAADGKVRMKEVAIYNCGSHGLSIGGEAQLENVNVGVEQANGDDDINIAMFLNSVMRDVKLGGTNGYLTITNAYVENNFGIGIENYQKVLGSHRFFYQGGYYERVAVAGETPNKKISDYVIKITPNISGHVHTSDWAFPIFVHDLKMTAAAHTLRYWIYNDSGVTLNDTTAKDDIFLKAGYIKSYDDTSEYTNSEIYSSQIDILDAADADDWDYLEVTLTPAVAGKVRVILYSNKYLAATNIIVDSAVVIS